MITKIIIVGRGVFELLLSMARYTKQMNNIKISPNKNQKSYALFGDLITKATH